jgi:hypothetical protein
MAQSIKPWDGYSEQDRDIYELLAYPRPTSAEDVADVYGLTVEEVRLAEHRVWITQNEYLAKCDEGDDDDRDGEGV